MSPLRAVIYRRVSQEDRESNLPEHIMSSLNSQLEICKQDCAERGWEIIRDFNDGFISGSEWNRTEFLELWKMLKANKADIVVARDLSRLFRDQALAIQFYQDILGLKKQIYCHHTGMIQSKEQIMIMSYAGEQAIESGRKNQKEMMQRKAKEGLPFGGLPTGYRRVIINGQKTWELNEEKAQLVRNLFHDYLEGNYGYTELGRKYGIDRSSVKQILKHRVYTGTYEFKEKFKGSQGKVVRTEKYEYQAKIPIIIQKRVFDKVQEKIRANTHKSLLQQIAEETKNSQ